MFADLKHVPMQKYVLDIDEDEYCRLMGVIQFKNELIGYLFNISLQSEHANKCKCVEKIYDWNIVNGYDDILAACHAAIQDILTCGRDCDTKLVSKELLEAIIISRCAPDNFVVGGIICTIQSYPIMQFKYFFELITDNYDLQKIFDGAFRPKWHSYSVELLEMIADGFKINFESVLSFVCCYDSAPNNLIYIINHVDMHHLSKQTLRNIYRSRNLSFETIINCTNAKIDFSQLHPLWLLTNVSEGKIELLTKGGYNFEEMIASSARRYKKNAIMVAHEKNARPTYITKLIADINLCEATLKDLLSSSINYCAYTIDFCAEPCEEYLE